MPGATFDFIAARAAHYPVIMRRSQISKAIRRVIGPQKPRNPPGLWLRLNTQRINRIL